MFISWDYKNFAETTKGKVAPLLLVPNVYLDKLKWNTLALSAFSRLFSYVLIILSMKYLTIIIKWYHNYDVMLRTHSYI